MSMNNTEHDYTDCQWWGERDGHAFRVYGDGHSYRAYGDAYAGAHCRTDFGAYAYS